MRKNKTKITIVTHDGTFHADDVFAVATLSVAFEKTAEIEVIRTRSQPVVETGDYVVDVGGVYDPENNRFDHHQIDGAGERQNRIPYASFGLVWKKVGEKISGSDEGAREDATEDAKKIAEMIDKKLVQPIDAVDNGISVAGEIFEGIRPYDVRSIISAMNPNWKEGDGKGADNTDGIFLKAVGLAKNILVREIKLARDEVEAEKFVIDAYNESDDKRIIILEKRYPWINTLSKFSEPLFVVYPKGEVWQINAVPKKIGVFENRKDLPAAWAGKKGAELSVVVGAVGGIFCHRSLFMAVAETKETAIGMAKIAVDA